MPDSGHQTPFDQPSVRSAMLTVLTPESLNGLAHDLAGESVLVGRDSDCDFVVPSELVSKSHALISPILSEGSGEALTSEDLVDGDRLAASTNVGADSAGVTVLGYEVGDAGSTNGTMVNGLPVDGSTRLRPGDRIMVGDVELRFDTDHEPAPSVRTASRAERRTVLVSYAAADQPQADRVIDQLRRAGHQVWFDRSADGSGWTGRLLDVVWSCDLALFLVSPASAGSAKVAREVHLAGAERTPVVAVLIERASLSKDLHWYLTQHQPVDLRNDSAAGLTELAEVVRTTRRKRIARPAMTLAVLAAIFWTVILLVGLYLAFT